MANHIQSVLQNINKVWRRGYLLYTSLVPQMIIGLPN